MANKAAQRGRARAGGRVWCDAGGRQARPMLGGAWRRLPHAAAQGDSERYETAARAGGVGIADDKLPPYSKYSSYSITLQQQLDSKYSRRRRRALAVDGPQKTRAGGRAMGGLCWRAVRRMRGRCLAAGRGGGRAGGRLTGVRRVSATGGRRRAGRVARTDTGAVYDAAGWARQAGRLATTAQGADDRRAARADDCGRRLVQRRRRLRRKAMGGGVYAAGGGGGRRAHGIE